jgi:hypothetical protein
MELHWTREPTRRVGESSSKRAEAFAPRSSSSSPVNYSSSPRDDRSSVIDSGFGPSDASILHTGDSF